MAWLSFPDWRAACASGWRLFAGRMAAACQGQTQAIGQAGKGLLVSGHGRLHGAWHWGRHHWPWLALAGLVLLLPAAGVWWWAISGGRTWDAFDEQAHPVNRQVAALLAGEHLVPPPPLPPDVFMTAEIEQQRPMTASADRRWDQMDDAFVQRLLLVFKIMHEEHGYDMVLLEGYRSPARQDMLAARGSHVTQARAWQSYHQYGLAADCAFLRGGKVVITEKDPWAQRGYELYGQVAEQVGLTWGGRWQMLDLGHVEWRKPGAKAHLPESRDTAVTPGNRG